MSSKSFEGNLMNEMYRMLKHNQHTDCSLIADGGKIDVHRVVLCALSPFFDNIFAKQAQVQQATFFFNLRLTFVELQMLVKYMYTGKVDLRDEDSAEAFQTLLNEYALPALRGSKEQKETKPQVQTTFASPTQPNACSTLANTTIDIDTIKTPKHERVGIYDKYFQSTSKFKVEPAAPKIMEIRILDCVKSNPKITTSPVFDDDECVDEPKKKTRGKHKTSGSKSFVCGFCGKSLPRVQSLRSHEAVCKPNKSREEPTCQYCGKKFVYENSRCKHEAVCAPQKDRRPFRCEKCDKVYANESSLKRHYAKAHQ